MTRTSSSQFEVMVDFMERNGDLNKPADGPSGRLRTINKWQELTNALNLDTTGTSKTVDKWKRVWSDLKNNTKRKASRIHRAAGGPGGGPACKLALSDLEQRVLNIIGPQAVTGLSHLPPPATSPTQHHAISPQRHTGTRRAIRGRRRLLRSPALTPQHSARRAARRHFDATEQFLNSDEHWRNLATEFVTENLRLREVELQQQTQWQTLFAKFIDLVDTISNIISKYFCV